MGFFLLKIVTGGGGWRWGVHLYPSAWLRTNHTWLHGVRGNYLLVPVSSPKPIRLFFFVCVFAISIRSKVTIFNFLTPLITQRNLLHSRGIGAEHMDYRRVMHSKKSGTWNKNSIVKKLAQLGMMSLGKILVLFSSQRVIVDWTRESWTKFWNSHLHHINDLVKQSLIWLENLLLLSIHDSPPAVCFIDNA